MTLSTNRDRLSCAISNTPGTGGNFTTSTAQSGFLGFTAADDGLTFRVEAQEGTAWEVRSGCVYTHSTTTLTRGTLEKSSTGSAISFTAAAVLTNVVPASTFNLIEQQLDRGFTFIRNDASTTQSLTGSSWNKIGAALTTVVANTNSWWDTTNKKFLPTRAGWYRFDVIAAQNNSAANVMYPALYKNGTIHLQGGGFSLPNNNSANMSAMVLLNGTTDFVEFYVYTSTANTTLAIPEALYFQASYIGV